MARFEERLFRELVEQHGSLLTGAPGAAATPLRVAAPPRRRRRRPAATIALAVALALAAIVIGLSRGGGGASASAVVANPDGTVTVTISELVGVAPADQRLRELGLPIAVVPVTKGCPVKPSEVLPAGVSPGVMSRIVETVGPAGRASVRIDPRAIPEGDTLLISANERQPGLVALRELVIKGAAPSCVPPGPGE